jgi:hypothetical protein
MTLGNRCKKERRLTDVTARLYKVIKSNRQRYRAKRFNAHFLPIEAVRLSGDCCPDSPRKGQKPRMGLC